MISSSRVLLISFLLFSIMKPFLSLHFVRPCLVNRAKFIKPNVITAGATGNRSYQVSRLFSTSFSSSEDTVVSRCTEKISKMLNPMRISVTSTNDDPNGSHVRFLLFLLFLYYKTLEQVNVHEYLSLSLSLVDSS
jgi:hypothetical protein